MSGTAQVPVFDGHNDILLKLDKSGGRAALPGFVTGMDSHVDMPKARLGGFAGGFFAMFVPSPFDFSAAMEEMKKSAYDLPLPDPVAQEAALPVVMRQASLLMQLEDAGAVKICRTVGEIEATIGTGRLATVLHLEGAEAIDPEFHALDVLYAAGLRSLGPVWSRNTIFGEGVPFTFPASPDIGGGLTADGKRLVKRCNEIGVLVDLSHLNEAGFWDVAKASDKPLVATHSNAHALCAHARNLTDRQLDAIAESDGMVGLNFATAFLREDGAMRPDVPLEQMIRHLDHMVARMGEDRVGLGSDFDGAMVPEKIGSIAGLPHLIAAMEKAGYGQELIEKIAWRNWMRVLEKTWSA
ncbi:dipeptidase [Marimonas lutisalis]|uniref:dipeptidase n=1 Tax=Marimonas lutisalis TaxID=2545756 RepID=UPI0010F96934|nr:dipeptidase [Marimonas lutisalis]